MYGVVCKNKGGKVRDSPQKFYAIRVETNNTLNVPTRIYISIFLRSASSFNGSNGITSFLEYADQSTFLRTKRVH